MIKVIIMAMGLILITMQVIMYGLWLIIDYIKTCLQVGIYLDLPLSNMITIYLWALMEEVMEMMTVHGGQIMGNPWEIGVQTG